MKAPRKAIGGLIVAAMVMAAGLIVKPGNIGAVCLALTGIYATFVTGHTATELKHGGKDDDAC